MHDHIMTILAFSLRHTADKMGTQVRFFILCLPFKWFGHIRWDKNFSNHSSIIQSPKGWVGISWDSPKSGRHEKTSKSWPINKPRLMLRDPQVQAPFQSFSSNTTKYTVRIQTDWKKSSINFIQIILSFALSRFFDSGCKIWRTFGIFTLSFIIFQPFPKEDLHFLVISLIHLEFAKKWMMKFLDKRMPRYFWITNASKSCCQHTDLTVLLFYQWILSNCIPLNQSSNGSCKT